MAGKLEETPEEVRLAAVEVLTDAAACSLSLLGNNLQARPGHRPWQEQPRCYQPGLRR